MTYQQTRTENQWWQGESQHCVTPRQTTTIWTFTTDTETSGQWSNSKSPVYLNIIPDNAECLMWRGCGGCQLPNSITNYQQHFTIIRGNNPNPNTANRWRGSFGAGLLNSLTLSRTSKQANHQFTFLRRKFRWFSVSIAHNLKHLKLQISCFSQSKCVF